ncbi:hypothetical protein REPUB_Repub01dG0020200 [Reevesia pubescens]
MLCQGDKKTISKWTVQKRNGGKKIEARSDVVKAIEKAPDLKRMGLRFTGTSMEVKRKSNRKRMVRNNTNASSKIENCLTKIEETTRFQFQGLKNNDKTRFKIGGNHNRRSIFMLALLLTLVINI